MVLDLSKELDLRGDKEKAMEEAKAFVDEMIVSLALTRDLVRRSFPDVANQQFADAQKSPQAVSAYVREALKEASKQGLTTSNPTSSS